MKKIYMAIFLAALTWSCSGGGNSSESTQEMEVADSINQELDAAQEELRKETDETLNEVDSLLEKI